VKNPFKVGEKVITKVGGSEVEAVVTKLWQNELQVRTPDNELRWRTMYTVWYPGGSPLARPVKQSADAKAELKAPATTKPIAPSGKNGSATPKAVRRSRSRKRGIIADSGIAGRNPCSYAFSCASLGLFIVEAKS
jgi:hypothetical protein